VYDTKVLKKDNRKQKASERKKREKRTRERAGDNATEENSSVAIVEGGREIEDALRSAAAQRRAGETAESHPQ
jgi:hypothetical protein